MVDRALLNDLFPFSQANPTSANYSPDMPDIMYDTNDPESADYAPRRGDVVKTVVFSQWTKLLDRIEDAFQECHIKFERLDGAMNRNERNRALEAFKNDPSVEVMLISLRAGGVGLNLTHACRVYLMVLAPICLVKRADHE